MKRFFVMAFTGLFAACADGRNNMGPAPSAPTESANYSRLVQGTYELRFTADASCADLLPPDARSRTYVTAIGDNDHVWRLGNANFLPGYGAADYSSWNIVYS